ncbi:MAG: type II toxin-antitoxin system VapB family antitoxin [Actinobacteria bacterium]|nr:type II toxin-antitoxin system VapB family antitoxin [Actinomycetota bacterium]
MAVNIKDPETDRLARELASVTGETITEATRRAIEERLARVRARALVEPRADAIRDLIERGRTRPFLDDRDGDAILGYDAVGLPA